MNLFAPVLVLHILAVVWGDSCQKQFQDCLRLATLKLQTGMASAYSNDEYQVSDSPTFRAVKACNNCRQLVCADMSANSACVWLLKPCGRRRGQRGNVAEIRRYRTGLLNQRATYFERLMRNGRIRVDDCAAIQELDQETREDKAMEERYSAQERSERMAEEEESGCTEKEHRHSRYEFNACSAHAVRTALASVRDDQVDDAGSDAACKALDFVKWVCRPLLDECLSPEEADSMLDEHVRGHEEFFSEKLSWGFDASYHCGVQDP